MRGRVPKAEVELLSRVPLFSGCTHKELRTIAGLGTGLEVPDGKVLTKQGTPGREFFLIVDGKADCRVGDKPVASFGPGDYFGELALLDGGRRTATITADGPVRLLVLTPVEFAGLLHASAGIAQRMLANLAGRLRTAQSGLGESLAH